MQVQLLVERNQDECIVKLAGTAYTFKRNEHGHLVSEITDQDHLRWVMDPSHHTAFKVYSEPKEKTIITGGKVEFNNKDFGVVAIGGDPEHEQVGNNAFAPHTGQLDESPAPEAEKPLPPYPQKGSKRPPKRN